MQGDRKARRLLDSDGVEVTAGCEISFCYGIPYVYVRASVIERDGRLIALSPGHKPSECPVRELKRHVGEFYVCRPLPSTEGRHE